MCPTDVRTIRDETTPRAARVNDLLRQAPIPPAMTAMLWRVSQKGEMCAVGHCFQKTAKIQSLEPVSTSSIPAIPASTIKTHASASIFRKPKGGIAIGGANHIPLLAKNLDYAQNPPLLGDGRVNERDRLITTVNYLGVLLLSLSWLSMKWRSDVSPLA